MTTRGLAVIRNELVMLWSSPLPYVTGAVFHLVLGVLAVNQLEVRGQAVVQPLVPIAGFLLLLAVPVLTTRTFAEEARQGTLAVLLAVPVPAGTLVAGKWFAVWGSSLVILAPSAVLVGLLSRWGDPDLGPAVSGLVGLGLLTATLTSIGVLASSLTSSQPVAGMASAFVAFGLWLADAGTTSLGAGRVVASISLSERLRTFSGGAIDTADVSFLAAATVAGLVLAALAIDLRRLR